MKRTVMLTGDAEAAAKAVATELGLDEYHAGLLPDQKVDRVEEILANKGDGLVAFVGDGINDAPSSAAAMWASPWVPWAPTPPSRPPTWS